MSQLNVIVFDKTGTLTVGAPQVTKYHASSGQRSVEVIMSMVAELESSSSHPLAHSIRDFIKAKFPSVEGCTGTEVEEVPGRGMIGRFDELNSHILVGNQALMSANNATQPPEVSQLLAEWTGDCQTLVLVALRATDKETTDAPFVVCAMFSISDEIRKEAKDVVTWLQGEGIEPWLVSGDPSIETVRSVATQAGIPAENVLAGVMPQDKARKIAELQVSGDPKQVGRRVVAMVGDGINDAPALAAADVGIAIGSGSESG